jgi:Ca2+-binding EF-hand superfamily protein
MEVITGMNDTKVDGYGYCYSGYYCWNDGERQELHDIFTLLDTENRGVISLAELVAILSLLVNVQDENDENDCTPTLSTRNTKVTSTNAMSRSSSSRSSSSSTLMTKRLLQRIRLQYGHGLRRLKSNSDTEDAPMLMVERNNTGKDAPMNNDDDDDDDATNDIFLNRDEFLCLATAPLQESHDVTDDDDDDETVFGLFDVDEKGYISATDLQRVATELNWYSPTDEKSTTAPPGGGAAGTGATPLDAAAAAAAAAAARADEPTRLSSLMVTHDDVTEMVYRLSSSGRITYEQFRTELLGRRSSSIP